MSTELPSVITQSTLWRETLAERKPDQFGTQRERLRSLFIAFRTHADVIAAEIRKDLPELTVHDISHLDALWETASTIAGKDYALTPTEGFVLGCTFLLHDLGLSLASIPGGVSELQTDPRWKDLVTFEYHSRHNRPPTTSELESPDEPIRNAVIFNMLRQAHAKNAERLIMQPIPARTESRPEINLEALTKPGNWHAICAAF